MTLERQLAKRQVKDALARVTAHILPSGLMRDKRYFELWQEKGYHVTVNHFYEPVPDTRLLPASEFLKERMPVGVDFREDAQIELLRTFESRFQSEYTTFPEEKPLNGSGGYYLRNATFGAVDAEVLYCMIRHLKPKKVIEIGSGFSTLVMTLACRQNALEGAPACQLLTIDPYPSPMVADGLGETITLLREPVQKVRLDVFEQLGERDILFIDSSHVLKIGSDVQYEFLEVLPRLGVGVHVHVHDIFFPRGYPEAWVKGNRWFWSEQYLLEAFLLFNRSFEIRWASRYMYSRHALHLEAAFPSCRTFSLENDNGGLASFWMERVS